MKSHTELQAETQAHKFLTWKAEWIKNGKTRFNRNHVHPWTGKPGWESLDIYAHTEDELTHIIQIAEKHFFQTWIRDNTGRIAAYLYRPIGAKAPWNDLP